MSNDQNPNVSNNSHSPFEPSKEMRESYNRIVEHPDTQEQQYLDNSRTDYNSTEFAVADVDNPPGNTKIQLYLKAFWEKVIYDNDTETPVFFPLIYLALAMIIFIFVLPGINAFSHVVKIDESNLISVSLSDIVEEKNDIYLILITDDEDILTLQERLYDLGFISLEDVTGTCDKETIDSLNELFSDLGMEEVVVLRTSGSMALID